MKKCGTCILSICRLTKFGPTCRRKPGASAAAILPKLAINGFLWRLMKLLALAMSNHPQYKMPLRKWPENEVRYKELVLYICQKCATDQKFGATKLNKILYFSDFLAYAELGEPITGFEYQRL